jgi:hypothetical protein
MPTDRLVPDHPGVVARLEHRHLAGGDLVLRAVRHADTHAAGDEVLEVRRLAQLGPGHRLEVVRPAPPWL